MIGIVRANAVWQECWPPDADLRVVLVRATPSIVSNSAGFFDLFCVGEASALGRMGERGWNVVPLGDGWYADDGEGGVAVWGQGRYWEVRDTPFSITEAVGPAGAAQERATPEGIASQGAASDAPTGSAGETLDVRKGIFGV